MPEIHKSTIPPVCDCCGRFVKQTSSLAILRDCKAMLCKDCWYEWYDGGHQAADGTGVDSDKLKAAVLRIHGLYGGEANLTQELLARLAALEEE